MKIQEVSRQTGLPRRTIYYYIDQKLISPRVNEANGYHDFSEKDVQKLFLIRKLREAGLPLADIQAILKQPRTTPFYLHKQLNVLQTQLLSIQKTISEMDRLTGQLPVCQSLDQLADMLRDTQFQPEDSSRYQMETGTPSCWPSISGWPISIRPSRNTSSFSGRKSPGTRWSTQAPT